MHVLNTYACIRYVWRDETREFKFLRDFLQTLVEIHRQSQRHLKCRRVDRLCMRLTLCARSKIEMDVHRTPRETLLCQPIKCRRKNIRVSLFHHKSVSSYHTSQSYVEFSPRDIEPIFQRNIRILD